MISRCFLLILVACVYCNDFTVSVFSYNVKGGNSHRKQDCCWTEPHGKKGPIREWQYKKMNTLVAKEKYDFLSLVETRDTQSSYVFPATKDGCTNPKDIVDGISSDYDAAKQSPWGWGCNTILYRKDMWKVEEQKQHWTCADKEKSHDDRVMAAARFASTNDANQKVVFVSIQYPHTDKPAPNTDYMADIKDLTDHGKYPVIFAGDMNMGKHQTTKQMKDDSGGWSVSTSKDLKTCCDMDGWGNIYDHIAVMTEPNSELTGKVDANFITGWEKHDSYSHLHDYIHNSAEHLPIDGKVTFTTDEDARQEHAQEDHHVDHHDVHAALSNTAGSRCGYTVSGDPKRDPRKYKNKSCAETGQEVGKTMDCFGYGEPGDWCSFSFTNPTPAGTTPNLDKCKESSIFLHDEPGTQADRGFGSGYKGAAKQWIDWSNKNSAALKKFRARGGSVVGPAVRGNHALENTKAFFDACGSPCNDKNSPSYIDVYALNLFMGSWNKGSLVGAISWSMDVMKKIRSQLGDRKVDFTNFSYLGSDATTKTHLNAMKAIEEYSSKPDWQHIRKVFFFFSKDVGGGTPKFNNRAEQEVDGKTLGHWWKETCDRLDSSGKSNDATFVEVAASAMPVHAKILALGGLFTLVAFLFLRSRKHAQDKELYQVLTNAIEEEI